MENVNESCHRYIINVMGALLLLNMLKNVIGELGLREEIKFFSFFVIAYVTHTDLSRFILLMLATTEISIVYKLFNVKRIKKLEGKQ